jgi:MerR family transcriptional regulator, redox-sensitive transcriptional activator SoxR
MAGLSIGAVARRAGLRPSALRYYEQVGLIAPQPRSSGRRRYDAGVFNALAVITFAKRAGFSIAETRLLLTGFGVDVTASARWRHMARRKQAELDQTIANARRMKNVLEMTLTCRCMTLDECGRRLTRSKRIHDVP